MSESVLTVSIKEVPLCFYLLLFGPMSGEPPVLERLVPKPANTQFLMIFSLLFMIAVMAGSFSKGKRSIFCSAFIRRSKY